MTVYGYVRVSTEEQVDGTSLTEQRRTILGMAMPHGWEPVMLEDAGVSGALPLFERPQGSRLKDLGPGDVLLVAKLDRFSRNAADALAVIETWERRGVRMIIYGFGDVIGEWAKGSAGRLLVEILAVFAGHERRMLRERQRDGQRAKRRNGGHIGGLPPFGYRKIGAGKGARLEPDPVQQQAIVTIVEARRQGKSLQKVVDAVREMYGISISKPTVRAVLQRAANAEA